MLAFLEATRETVGTRGEGALGFLHTVTNFFTYDGLNVYIGDADSLDRDNGDNGTYIVDAALNIVRREHVPERFAGAVPYAFDDLDEEGKEYYGQILLECLENRAALEECGKRRQQKRQEEADADRAERARLISASREGGRYDRVSNHR